MSFASFAAAQQLPIKSYTTSDGLAHNHVKRIVKDSRGYLWFATYEGLSRFDGYCFTNYGMRDGLGHIIVNDIAEDRQGRLWLGTNGGGVARLINDPREASSSQPSGSAASVRQKFINFRVGEAPGANQVNALLFDAEGDLWCSTDAGLYRAVVGQDRELKFEPVVLHHARFGEPMPAFADRQGRLWFGFEEELVEVVRGQIIKYGPEDKIGRHLVTSAVEDQQSRLLVANEHEVFEFIAPPAGQSRGQWQRFPITLAPDQRVTKMAVDAAGTLWIGTRNGLIKYRDGKQTLYTEAQGLCSNSILALTEDRNGNLWIGAGGGGACKLSGELITSFTKAEGLPNQDVIRVIEDRQGRIYASVRESGLVEIVEGRAVPVPGSQAARFSASFSWKELIPVQDSRGDWWIRTLEGLFCFAGPELQLRRGRKFGADDGLPAKPNPLVAEDLFGHLWLTYNDALFRLDLARQGRAVFERMPVSAPLSGGLTQISDRAGALWLGGHGKLTRWMNGKTTVLQPAAGLPEVNSRALFQDSRGWLWVGLRFKGVSVTKDPTAETPTFINYSMQDGLVSDTVWTIAEDDRRRIYLGTGKGLDQLDPLTGRIRHFGAKEGLAGDLINHCLKDRSGNIWVATTQGLSKLNPRAERIADPPPIYLSRVQVAGEDLPLAETGARHVPEFELPAARNNLLVEFVALSFQGEQRLRYQYKLEGVDADWSPPSDVRSVNYARLAPDSYQFLARAINQDGVMSPEPAVLQFRILRPIWQRWWFVSLAALGVGLTALPFYRSRIKRIVELERMRTRIATDLHDDIGSSLSQIAILSEVSRQRLGQQENGVGESLAQIADTSRELVDAMSDIVWAINPRRDRVSDLVQRMREFAADVFTAREIEFSFRAPAAGQELRLNADVRGQLYLIFKEAVNNAARHSGCTQAEIEFEVAPDRLLLHVRDNGRGFDPNGDAATSRNGNGLASMRERARALGGEIEIISQANLGTAVKLNLPLSPRAGWRRRR
jgi:signal transduction histidine kinase/ligand-binding sensor domain-containing protein